MTTVTTPNLRTYAKDLPTTNPLKPHLLNFGTQAEPGLYLLATCKEPTCADKDLTKWINRGAGTFQMNETVYTTSCEKCSADYNLHISPWLATRVDWEH